MHSTDPTTDVADRDGSRRILFASWLCFGAQLPRDHIAGGLSMNAFWRTVTANRSFNASRPGKPPDSWVMLFLALVSPLTEDGKFESLPCLHKKPENTEFAAFTYEFRMKTRRGCYRATT